MGWIYKITNQVNGKMYIGKTEEPNPYNRWKGHLKNAKSQSENNRYLYNSMNKYGVDQFKFELIEEVPDGKLLCEAEINYIQKYRTYIGFDDCNGYNMTLGGEGSSLIDIPDEMIINYYEDVKSIRRTASHFNISQDTIRKYLVRNKIKILNRSEFNSTKYAIKNGGVVMINYIDNVIKDIMDAPKQIADKYGLNSKIIGKALRKVEGYESGKSQGYLWFNLYELPKELKPLLDEYYASHLDEDTLEIDEYFNYVYN